MAHTSQRLEEWEQTIQSETQQLVKQVTIINSQIASSKTATKRQYYEKKFKKAQADMVSMLVAGQRIREIKETALGESINAN